MATDLVTPFRLDPHVRISLAGTLLFAALLIAIPNGTQAEEKSVRRATDHKLLSQNLVRGQEFQYESRRYQHLPEVRAIRLTRNTTPAQAITQIGAKSSDLLDSRPGLAFVRSQAVRGPATARTETVAGQLLYPTAVNVESGRIGFLPGTIIVQPKQLDNAPSIALTHNLKLLRTYDHLGIAILVVPQGRDVLSATTQLAADARVTSAEPEVVEAIRQAF
jgi:hypothetical protein